jgi:hypothetical protein
MGPTTAQRQPEGALLILINAMMATSLTTPLRQITAGGKVRKLRSAAPATDKLLPFLWEQTMRKLLIVLAAASIFTAASAATATAQVTGIRHSDGSWTFVDANGRDIHKDYHTGRAAQHGNRGTGDDAASERSRTSRHYREDHKVRGYLPWQAR